MQYQQLATMSEDAQRALQTSLAEAAHLLLKGTRATTISSCHGGPSQMKKVIGRALILGLVAAAPFMGCSTGGHNQGSSPVSQGPSQDGTGTVGAQLTIPSG